MYTKQQFVGVGVLTAITLGLVFLFGFAAVPAFAQTSDDYGVANSGNYCPKLSITMQRGARDVSYSGQVSELQKFISDYYDIDPDEMVTGFFGRITQGYVQQFQREQGLPTFGIAGSMTRAAIAKVCTSNTFSGTGQTNPNTMPTNTNTQRTAITPAINSFIASPTSVSAGQAVTLSWGTSLATDCGILRDTNNWVAQHLGITGTYTVYPTTSTTYTLSCAGTADGSGKDAQGAERNAFVSVTPYQSSAITPSINTFTVSQSQISSGQPVTLSWTSSLATKCGILRDSNTWVVMDQGTSGSYTVYPTISTTYTLSCMGTADGSGKDAPGAERTAFVSVTPYQSSAITPSINTFIASPSQVTAGQGVSLSWTSSLATNCGILRDTYTWVAMNLGTSGTYTVYPTTSTTYTLSCAGTADGSGKDAPGAERNLFVQVAPSPAPTCSASATSATPSPYTPSTPGALYVKPNSSATITWTSQNADYVTFNGEKGNPSGSFTFNNLTAVTNTYYFTVYGKGGSGVCNTTVYVDYKG